MTKHSVSRPVTIWSDGTRLAADLWSPPDLAPDAQIPGFLLVHGYGGRREQLNTAYARKFAALGCIVLCFDYRGYGGSAGKLVRVDERSDQDAEGEFDARVQEIREVVDNLDQLEDVRSALAFLMGEPQVDANRIGIWGSSNGGGLAMATACQFEEIKVLISQVGSLNTQDLLRRHDAGEPVPNADLVKSARESWEDRIALARGERSPLLAPRAMRGSPEQYAVRGAMDWDRYRRYDPMRDLDSLNAASLIIDAKEEELFDIARNGQEVYERIRDRMPARYETIPGTHYDVYSGEGYRAALALEKEWISKHLIGDI